MASVPENYVQSVIPHFDGRYDHWSMSMENFLRSNEYWGLVEMRIVVPEGEAALRMCSRRELMNKN